MGRCRRHLEALCVVLALVGGAMDTAGAAELPPAELFFKVPEIGRAVLSPSGRWLAMSSNHRGARVSLVVFDLREWGQVKLAAGFNDADIRRFDWVNDDRLVFDVIDLDRGGGDQPFGAGLFSVRPDGSDQRQLIELQRDFVAEMRTATRDRLRWNHRLLHVPNDGGDEVIVGEYSFSNSGDLRDVMPKRLNVVNGRSRNLAPGTPPDTRDWWFDARANRGWWSPPRRVAIASSGSRRAVMPGSPWRTTRATQRLSCLAFSMRPVTCSSPSPAGRVAPASCTASTSKSARR